MIRIGAMKDLKKKSQRAHGSWSFNRDDRLIDPGGQGREKDKRKTELQTTHLREIQIIVLM